MERISLQISLPSVALKRFIDKVLAEDDFFSFALENPMGAFAEAGVSIAEGFIPADFAVFFGILGRMKALAAEKKLENACFEEIFGEPARVYGVTLLAEASQGFFRDWGGQEAFQEQGTCFTAQQEFQAAADRQADTFSDAGGCGETQSALAQRISELLQTRSGLEVTSKSSETFRSQNTQWDNVDSVQNRRSETGTTKNFEGSSVLGDRLRGPLLHPEQLAMFTGRMTAFLDILTRGGKG